MAIVQDGPGWVTGASSARPLEPSPNRLSPLHHANPTASPTQSSRHEIPPPNPHFVFPPRLASTSPLSTATGPVIRRRPLSAIEPRSKSPIPSPEIGLGPSRTLALPAFTFNPGAALPQDPFAPTLLSPPTTPNSLRPISSPSRPAGHGHRRGGSEFVGGSIRHGNSIAVMSQSPTKSDGGFTSPGLAPPRRGHRRGVSCVVPSLDIPPLHSPPAMASSDDDPAADASEETCQPPIHRQSPAAAPHSAWPGEGDWVSPTLLTTSPLPSTTPTTENSPRQARAGRAPRVGFSDTLEFIPRPLSLVSSDASSTTTARPGHAVSDSISSIVSAASPSGYESPTSTLPRSTSREVSNSRPSTASAVLENTPAPESDTSPQPRLRRRNSIPTLLGPSEGEDGIPTPAKTPKRWSFFGLDAFSSSALLTKASSPACGSSESITKAPSGGWSSEHESDSTETGRDGLPSTQKGKKNSGKIKGVKGWAGSILPLKPRGPKRRSRASAGRPPTPTAPLGAQDDDEVEVDDMPETEPAAPDVAKTEFVTTTCEQRPQPRDDASYPMIDLDAALGPFNTPLTHNPEWDAAQRAAGSHGRRRLHSAQGLKGFAIAGMYYHRRAESAPNLPPFDAGRAGRVHRFGSNSTMADVFEEDEEEDEEDEDEEDEDEDEAEGGSASDTASEKRVTDEEQAEHRQSPGAPSAREPGAHQAREARSRGKRQALPVPDSREFDPLGGSSGRGTGSRPRAPEGGGLDDRQQAVFRRGKACRIETSAPTEGLFPSPAKTSGAAEVPMLEAYPTAVEGGSSGLPISPYSMGHASSSHPSPRSPMSVDAQRISTAPSSVTDEHSFRSLLMGEPGPEVRISADYDVPSVTSSTSTMTRDSVVMTDARSSQPSLREPRPASVSSSAFGRRRSSLVSLSRLISSAHGERSKLYMEVTLDSEAESKRSRPKGSKTKQRLGRMMHFWKPSKDGSAST